MAWPYMIFVLNISIEDFQRKNDHISARLMDKPVEVIEARI
jgi:hypothetical protein